MVDCKAEIKVRAAKHSDTKVIFEWRNDELTRRMFRTSETVEWDAHCKWFAATLQNSNRCLLMCYSEQAKNIAVVRFDVEDDFAEVSINLSPSERGKGFAPKCLLLAVDVFEKEYSSVHKLIAEIKTSNIASKKSFEKVGFTLDDEKDGFWYLSASINS